MPALRPSSYGANGVPGSSSRSSARARRPRLPQPVIGIRTRTPQEMQEEAILHPPQDRLLKVECSRWTDLWLRYARRAGSGASMMPPRGRLRFAHGLVQLADGLQAHLAPVLKRGFTEPHRSAAALLAADPEGARSPHRLPVSLSQHRGRGGSFSFQSATRRVPLTPPKRGRWSSRRTARYFSWAKRGRRSGPSVPETGGVGPDNETSVASRGLTKSDPPRARGTGGGSLARGRVTSTDPSW
jgi:hypothetical protein